EDRHQDLAEKKTAAREGGGSFASPAGAPRRGGSWPLKTGPLLIAERAVLPIGAAVARIDIVPGPRAGGIIQGLAVRADAGLPVLSRRRRADARAHGRADRAADQRAFQVVIGDQRARACAHRAADGRAAQCALGARVLLISLVGAGGRQG